MELRQLKTFQVVATLLSFNRAAEQLHYSQSTVSAQIQALEDELNVLLFDRLGRKVLLTEAGEKLLQYAKRIADLTEQTVSEVTGTEPQGGLTIRVPETVAVQVMPRVIERFCNTYPAVSLRFVTCASEGLEMDLRNGLIDLALIFDESVVSANLNATPIGFEELYVVTGPNHPLTKSQVTTKMLARERLLFSRTDCGYLKMFERIFMEAGLVPKSVLEFNSLEAVRSCVKQGIGLSVMPGSAVASDLNEGSMTALDWEGGRPETALLMIHHQSKWLSPTLLAFMEEMRECMSTSFE